jgi:hypothetical protein
MYTLTRTISFDVAGRAKTYDPDLLATALLVYLDQPGDDPMARTRDTSAVLIRDYGFGWGDSNTYATGARHCHQLGIDPYGDGRPTR